MATTSDLFAAYSQDESAYFRVTSTGAIAASAGITGTTGTLSGALTAAGATLSSTLDLNAALDLDHALTATGSFATIDGTLNSAAGVASGLAVSIATVTTAHTSGIVAGVKSTITSLAGDTGGDFAAFQIVSVDGGGTTPTHVGIYCDDPLDALIKVAADGDGGFVVGATMTISPEASAESGYIKVAIGSTIYQIPIYAA